MQTQDIRKFCGIYKVPEHLANYVPRLFSAEEIGAALACDADRLASPEFDAAWLEAEYRRGFVNKTGEAGVYRLNDLYGMLDVYVVSRKEEYDALFSPAEKHEIDDWYFDAYFSGLTPDEEGRLTEDKVMTLDETLAVIAADSRQIYLNFCDCRSLTGECGKTRRTCLTWRNAPNSFVDRGLSTPLTTEEAMDVVRQADKQGLMHTTMSGGICNCCSDCCYLFRSQRRAGTYGLWPASRWIVSFDESKCISCGLCARRCWMNVFTKSETGITMDTSTCVGCGLCVNTCPGDALTLIKEDDPNAR